MVTVRILRKEKVNGTKVRPGEIRQMPEWAADDLVKRGMAEVVSSQALTNEAMAGLKGSIPAGSRLLIKLPRQEEPTDAEHLDSDPV